MNIVGHVFLSISTLLFFRIAFILFSKGSSEGRVGSAHAWSMVFFHFLFMAGMLVTWGIIQSRGGFAWVSSSGALRIISVWVSLILSIMGSCMWALLKIEEDLQKGLLKIGSHWMPILIGLFLLCSGAVLLNDAWRSTFSISALQWPLMLAAVMGGLGVLTFILYLVRQ